jgi:16S rRNA (adenine1518-N6/adenine1519-N6)-dimethyltransferase
MTLTQVREALATLDLRPSKALGQNFLIDGNILRIIVEQADVRHDETVLEIGPGLGVLTAALLPRARHVIAIEKDARLCAYLREHCLGVELIHADAVDWLDAPPEIPAPFKVVANLPYNVSSAILERLVDGKAKPRAIVVTLQREVAQRLAATPLHDDYGALTLFTQLWYHVTIAHVISPHCFFPEPKVDSAVVLLERRDPRVKLEEGAPFHEIVRRGFSQRRKMLRKLLAEIGDADAAFRQVGIGSAVRGEALSLEQWIRLANAFRR